jgi:hypothetical protein
MRNSWKRNRGSGDVSGFVPSVIDMVFSKKIFKKGRSERKKRNSERW